MQVARFLRLACLAVPISLVAAWSVAAADEPIRIGVSVPLSGEGAGYGADIKNGLLFAAEKLAPGKYQLIIEDDQCSEKGAVTVAHKLIHIDKVKYVLGFGCSGALLGAAPVYERAKVLVIASATGAPAISHAGDYIFRTIPSLNVAAEKLYRHVGSIGEKVGILSEQTAYCQGLKDAFTARNNTGVLEIITEDYLPETTDFRTQLAKLKTAGVETLFINPQSEAGLVTIVKQLQALNWKPALLSAYYPGSPVYLEAFGKGGDGIVYADLPFSEQMLNASGLRLLQEFVTRYGVAKSGEFNVTLSYLAFAALHQALSSGAAAADEVKDYLYSQKFTGIVDGYGFDPQGDVVSDKITFVLKQIKDGKPVSL